MTTPTLEECIRKILDDYADNRDINRQDYLATGTDKYLEVRDISIAQIMEAIEAAGYIPPIRYSATAMDAMIQAKYNTRNYMTGEEWLSRFEQELEGVPRTVEGIETEFTYRESSVLVAAHRASMVSSE